MPISAVDTIPLAIEHTKQQLFKPFRFGQWTKLAVVGLLAGELGSGGGFNGSNFNFPQHPGASRLSLPGTLGGIDPALLAALIAVLGTAVVYGTDVFCAVVLRPALALVDDGALLAVTGSVHRYGDRRMPVPGVLGVLATAASTVLAAVAEAVDRPEIEEVVELGS